MSQESAGGSTVALLASTVIALICGALLAAFSLVIKEPVPLSAKPEEVVDFRIVYVDSGANGSWQAAEANFGGIAEAAPGTSITLDERALNAWGGHLVNLARDANAAEEGDDAAAGPKSSLTGINFVLEGETVQASARMTMPGTGQAVTVFSRGTLEKKGAAFRYVPDETYVGSCPVPGPLQGIVLNRFLSPFTSAESLQPLRDAWMQPTTAVELTDSRVTVSFP